MCTSLTRGCLSVALAAALALLVPTEVRAQETRLTPSVVIGVTDGDERYVFGSVAQIAAGPDERLYVVDNLARRVQVFDPDGSWVRTYGRRGRGPGEFEAPWRLAVTSDGTLVVRDLDLERYTLFADGEHRSALPALNDRTYWDLMRTDAHGRFYDGRRTWQDSASTHYVLQFALEGAHVTRVDSIPVPRSVRDMVTLPGGSGFVDQPFASEFHWTVTPDGTVWTAEGAEDALAGWRAGELVRVITGPGEHVRIPDRLRDSAVVAAEAEVRAKMQGQAGLGSALDAIRRPEWFHPIQSLAADRAGRLWVERAGIGPRCPVRFEVINPASGARRVICLTAPAGQRLDGQGLAFGGHMLWVPSTDALGVARVLGYELPR